MYEDLKRGPTDLKDNKFSGPLLPPREAIDALFEEMELQQPDRIAFLRVLKLVRTGEIEVGTAKEERNAVSTPLIESVWKRIQEWFSSNPQSCGLSDGVDAAFHPLQIEAVITQLKNESEEGIARELKSYLCNTLTAIYDEWEKEILADPNKDPFCNKLLSRLNVLKSSHAFESDVFEYRPIRGGLLTAAAAHFHALGQLCSTLENFLGRRPSLEELREFAQTIPVLAREISRLPLLAFDGARRTLSIELQGFHLGEFPIYDVCIINKKNRQPAPVITFSRQSLQAIASSASVAGKSEQTTGCPARFAGGAGQGNVLNEFGEIFLQIVDKVYLPLMESKGIRASK